MSLYDDVNRSFGSYGTSDLFETSSVMPGDAPVHESWMDVPVFSRTETMPKFAAEEGKPKAGWGEAIFSPIAEEPASWKQTIGGLAQAVPLITPVQEWGKKLGAEGMKEQERIQPRFEDASPEYYTYLTGKTLVPMLEDAAILGAAGFALGGGTPASPVLAVAGAGAGVLKNLYKFMKLRAAMNAGRTGAQEYNKLKQNGYSDWAAIPLSIGYGGLEWLGDKVGLKALEANNLSVLKRLALSAASEVPGETMTTIGQAALDKISTDPDMTMDDFVKQVRDTVVVAGVVGAGGGAMAVPASRRFQKLEDKLKRREQIPEEAWAGLRESLNTMVADVGKVMPTIEQEYGPERAAALKRYLLFGIPMPPELAITPTERIARQVRDEQLNQQFGFGVQAGQEGQPNLPELGPGIAPYFGPAGGPPGAGPGGGAVAGAGQPQSYVDKLSGPKPGTQANVIEEMSKRDEAARVRDLEQKRQANLIGSGAATVMPGVLGEAPGVPGSTQSPGGPLATSPLPGRQTVVPGAPSGPTTMSTSVSMFGVPSPDVAAAEQGAEGGELGVPGSGPTAEAYARWKQQAIKAFIEAVRTGQPPTIPPMPGGVVTPQAIAEAESEARRTAGDATTPIPGMTTLTSPLPGPLGPAPQATTGKAQTGLRLGDRKGILTPQVQPNPPGLPVAPKAAGAPSATPGTLTPTPPATPGAGIQTAAAPTGTTGKTVTIATPNQKTKITARYRVVEADSVVASNDPVTFAPNPSYPSALQPRERAREGYQLQIEGMVRALNPEMLIASPTTAQGSPIVGPDMVVESGNGRTMAIKRAYVSSPAQGAAYKQALINSAVELGLDPAVIEGMKSPVLVRERTSEVPDRAAFAKEAGEADVSGMSAVEKARVDAQNMSQALAELAVLDEDGQFDPLSKANAQFVAEWMQTVPASERGALFQNGMLTREGVSRIKNALFAKAYPASDKLLTLVAESADPEIKNITNTMLGFAPAFARLRAMAEQGSRDSNLLVADEIAKAAETYLDYKNQTALDLQGFLMQQGLLEGSQYANETKAIAAVFNEHARSQAKLRTFINHMLRIANESGQGNLLGEMSAETKGDMIFLAYNLTEGGKKNDAIIRNILGLPAQEAGKAVSVPEGEPGIPGTGEGIQTPAREGTETGEAVAGAEAAKDILTKDGRPFKNKSSATIAARKAGEGYEAVQVEGGWVARKTEAPPAATGEGPVREGTILEQRLAEIQRRLDAMEQTTGEKPFEIGEKVTYLGKPATVESYKGMATVNVRTETGNVIGAPIKDVSPATPPATGEQTPEGKEGSVSIDNLGQALKQYSGDIAARYKDWVNRVYDSINKDITAGIEKWRNIGNSFKWARTFGNIVRPNTKSQNSPGWDKPWPDPNASVVIDDAKLEKNAEQYAKDTIQTWENKIRGKVGDLKNAKVAHLDGMRFSITGKLGNKNVRIEQDMIINQSSRGTLFNQFPARIYVDNKFTPEAKYKEMVAAEEANPTIEPEAATPATPATEPAPEPTPEGKVERTGNLQQGALPGLSQAEDFNLTAPEGEVGTRTETPAATVPEQTTLGFYDDAELSTEQRKARHNELQAELDFFAEQAQEDTQVSTVVEPDITTPVRERTASLKPQPSDPKLIATSVKLDMQEKGWTSFVGQIIRFVSDLGFIGRMARSFRFEYNHFIFVNKKTGEVLYENKVTSFSNRTCAMGSMAAMHEALSKARALAGTDDIACYFMHNHPGGDPMPSDNDIEVTKWLSSYMRKRNVEFGGHVIMNNQEYCVINDTNLQQYIDTVKGKKKSSVRSAALAKIEGATRFVNDVDELRADDDAMTNGVGVLGKNPLYYRPSSEGGGISFDKTAEKLAAYHMSIKGNETAGTIFFTDYRDTITTLTDLPELFLDDYKSAENFLKRAAENSGSSKIYMHVPSNLNEAARNNLEKLIKNGIVADASMAGKSFGLARARGGTLDIDDLKRSMKKKDIGKHDLSTKKAYAQAQEKITGKNRVSLKAAESPEGEMFVSNDEVTEKVLEGQPALENPAIRERVVGEVPLPERSATRYPYFGGGLLGRIIDTIRTYKYVDKNIQDRDVKALESLFMTPWALRKEHPEMKDALDIELQRHQDRKDLNAQLVGDPDNWNPENPVEHPLFGLNDDEVKGLQHVAQLSTVENELYTDVKIKELLAQKGVTDPEMVKRITRGYRAMKASYDNAIQKQIEARENMLFFPYQNEPWVADLERIVRLEDEEGKGARRPEKMKELEKALENYSPEEQARFRKAFATIIEPWNLVKKYRQQMGQRKFYTPLEHGEGDYILRIFDKDPETGEDKVVWSYRTRTGLEAAKIWEEMKRDPEMAEYHNKRGSVTKEAGTPESAYYRVYDDNLYRFMLIGMERLRASKTYSDEDISTFTKKMSQALADELKARAFGQRMMRRKHAEIGGYERKDIRASFLDYMAGTSGIITKQEAAAKFYDLLRSVDKNKPGTYDYVSRYIDDMLRNRDEVDRFFDKGKHMATLYYIAGNLRLPLVQITQNMIMSVPMMARAISGADVPATPEGLMKNLYKLGKHTTEAHRRVFAAMKDVTTGNMTPEEKAAVDTATRQGVTDAQFLKEIYGRMTNKWDRGAVKTFDYAMQPFQLLERMNRQAAFLSMYRFQKETMMKKGMTEAEASAQAISKANEFVYDTQVLYGKANMPEAMRGKTVGSKLLGMAYTFKQYPHHFIQYLTQGVKEGHKATIERMGEDADRLKFGPSMVYETPRFMYNYMKNSLTAPGFESVILSMAWTVALGGAAAFPFLDDLLELYERMSGNPIRAKMNRVVRAGVPTMIGMDLSSSLKVSAPWTVGTNFMEGLSESALGVYGGIAEKMGKSFEAAASGNFYKAVEAGSPTMIEYPMKAYREYQEGAKTARGKTIFDSDGNPLHPTMGEAALQAVGIKGARMKEEAQVYRSFEMIEQKFTKWRDRIYTMYRKADTYEKQAEVMSEITKFNMESQQKGMGGISPITRESLKRAMKEKPSKRWLQFGQGIDAQ